MKHLLHERTIRLLLLFVMTCFFKEITAGSSAEDYDYSHRKRDCEVKILSPGGAPLPGLLIGIAQIKNDFVFGGTIRTEGFDSLGDDYGQAFLNYFDIATPENVMKWEQVMHCSEKCDPVFSRADSLINWLLERKIPIRGRNLFSNEKEDLLPEWTRDLETDAFKQAMQERIDTAMSHFGGKVTQWDLIDEICHGEDGSLPESGMLQTKSGDPDIFGWILDEARKKDSVAQFVINDYDLITSSDRTTADKYTAILESLAGRFDLIGARGHFNDTMDKSIFEANINYLTEQLEKPVMLTDVDFSLDTGEAADKIEELMRTCFANPNVGGLIMGGWCERYMRSNDLTSYFVDSLNNETPVGKRWREVRDELKTVTSGNTDDSGMIRFTGFQGEYQILISCDFDTFYIEPGEGTKTIEITYNPELAVDNPFADQKITEISINGIALPVKVPARYNGQLFLTTYSLSGQRISRSPVNPAGGKQPVISPSPCCRVVRIETAGQVPLYTGKIMAIR